MITTLRDLHSAIDTLREDFLSDASLDSSGKWELYLGKKGRFNELTQALKTLLPENRKDAGKLLNELKAWRNEQLPKSTDKKEREGDDRDPTIPGLDLGVGHLHPVTHAMHEITQIFERIGFTRVRYPEVDGDYYVFEALNMPKNHPARDEWETFFVDVPIDKKVGKIVLSTHTSNGQVREMERLVITPPIPIINIV